MVRLLPASEWLGDEAFMKLADRIERNPDCSGIRKAVFASLTDEIAQSEEALRIAEEFDIPVEHKPLNMN